jgi:hypothetical protein
MSAGFKFKEITDAVLSGVDGIGIGTKRFHHTHTSMHT